MESFKFGCHNKVRYSLHVFVFWEILKERRPRGSSSVPLVGPMSMCAKYIHNGDHPQQFLQGVKG